MADSSIVRKEKNGYTILQINRPSKRNALDSEARRSLRMHLDAIRGQTKVIVITGTDGSFCSGMDLKEFSGAAPEMVASRKAANREWIDTLLAIRHHPAIVISAVNGYALGGGVSLINVADLALAAHEAQIGMPEMGFGTYPAMAAPSTQRMISAKRAAWLVLTAQRLDGRTAESWGLVNQSVPLADLEDAADELAQKITRFDTVALEESKRALDRIPQRISEWAAIMEEGQLVNQAIRARSTAAQEGLARFNAGERNDGQGAS